ncbi:hypothetical protein JCM10450v2_000117 [Rhodotorula kratochvilovae]
MSRDHKPPPLPLTQQPRRQRSLSTTSSTPAPLSPAYRLTERTRTITESMQAYTTERERRLLAVQDAWRLSRRLGGEVASLRSQIAQHPDDFSLRVKMNEAEKRRKEAKLREEVAKHALASPTMEGPPVLAAADDIEDQIALILVTSRLAVPGFFVVEELGLIQVGTPHLTDLAAIKALLRVEGVRRGAHAVLGVQTKAWEGEGGGLTGVGRAVRLRKG